MNKIFAVIIILLCAFIQVIAQDTRSDSLKNGRVCKLVLYNGFQTEGKITDRNNDTLTFQTDIINLYIPVKDIKFVLNPEIDVSDLEEIDTTEYSRITEPIIKTDTTDECDVYFDNKSVLKNAKLMLDTDSTLRAVKDNRSKIIKIAGIRKIVFKPAAPFGMGYLYGSLAGFALGFFSLAFTETSGHPSFGGVGAGLVFGLICSIPAGLIGGVVGVLSASDDVYLFDKGLDEKKIKRLKYVLEKHY